MKPPPEAYRFSNRLVSLEAGLHGIRYLSQGEAVDAPSIIIQALPIDAGAVDHLPSPGGTPGCLTRPGDMLILRAHRAVNVVATIISTADLGNSNSLQLKVEKLDRQSDRSLGPKGPSKASVALPVALSRGKPAAIEIEETRPKTGASPVNLARPSVLPSKAAEINPVSGGESVRQVRLPAVGVSLLVEGARAWRVGTLESLAEAQHEVVVGVRLVLLEDRASAYQLRMVANLSDGRLREALGHDVRAEAIGSTSIYGAVAHYRGPETKDWLPLCDVDFRKLS